MNDIVLICPANTSQMPYLNNYLSIFHEEKIQYSLIVWNRLNEPESARFIYTDKKKAHARGFIDYYKFCSYVKSIIKQNENIRKIIIFGIPTSFFIGNYIKYKFRYKYIFDIRDHHRILDVYFNLRSYMANAAINVISSNGFKSWLPKGYELLLSHNTKAERCNYNEKIKNDTSTSKTVSISCIGSLKDFEVNKRLLIEVDSSNLKNLIFNYHGDGVINENLILLSKVLSTLVVNVTGRYEIESEPKLYTDSDFINMFMSEDSINNRTCMSNRLYNSALYGVPLLILQNSFMAKVVKKHHLGIVFNDIQHFVRDFHQLAREFDFEKFEAGRISFFHSVAEENAKFKMAILEFGKAS